MRVHIVLRLGKKCSLLNLNTNEWQRMFKAPPLAIAQASGSKQLRELCLKAHSACFVLKQTGTFRMKRVFREKSFHRGNKLAHKKGIS